jgi:hypothetical protein
MKLFATAAALALGFFSCSANANEGTPLTHAIDLSADVEPSCTLGEVGFEGSGFEDASTFIVPITGGTPGRATGTLTFDQFACNARLRVDIIGKGVLENKVPGIGGVEYGLTIPYAASFSKDGVSFTNADLTTPLNNVYLEPSMSVQFFLKIDVYPDSTILAAGKYGDTLTMYFYPQI